jgi:hypothetical protein
MSPEVSSLEKEGENIRLHRFALFTACCISDLCWRAGHQYRVGIGRSGLAYNIRLDSMLILLVIQITLGALRVWTAKAVIPTTVYVATGALVLGTSLLLTLRTFAMVSVRIPAWK